MATAAINVNVDKKVKDEATAILKDLGLNMSTAINMFLTQVVKTDGIPFEIVNAKPSKQLQEALEELEYMEKHLDEYKKYDNWKELRKDLLSDDEV